jgi:hypothetical protein
VLLDELVTSLAASARGIAEELIMAEVTRISTARVRNVRHVFLHIPNISFPSFDLRFLILIVECEAECTHVS